VPVRSGPQPRYFSAGQGASALESALPSAPEVRAALAQQNEVRLGPSGVIFELGLSRTKVPRLWLAPFLTNLSSEVAVVQMTRCPFSAGSV
jgi:hypothetical protein